MGNQSNKKDKKCKEILLTIAQKLERMRVT